ncbi:hypothetical protein GALMADRAFT_230767 [Galerina marginata CBS 339.88]|uniref:Secreted protein n=1 Tax=Galerina marginata (strain CBS 339.88) TaxID=685588 RepID=A0A067SNG3_GALM3|nr:hypothetical protein GALMADRAFT_230767 [Galerina marginata CBS 339.88]
MSRLSRLYLALPTLWVHRGLGLKIHASEFCNCNSHSGAEPSYPPTSALSTTNVSDDTANELSRWSDIRMRINSTAQ